MSAEIPPEVQFKSAKASLLGTMDLYGINPELSRLYLGKLVEAAQIIALKEAGHAVQAGETRDQVGSRQGEENR